MADQVLPRAFFARESLEVAPDLIGKLLCKPAEGLVARIVEAEAYRQDDPACHAFRGQTARNAVLFGRPGHLYVYFTYGMHWCANVATGPEGVGQGVLLRAAEPLAGLELLRVRRTREGREAPPDRDLLRGPARLAQAFGLDRAADGLDLCASDALLQLVDDGCRPPLTAGPRVGVAAAPDLPWRWTWTASPHVSPYTRHPRA